MSEGVDEMNIIDNDSDVDIRKVGIPIFENFEISAPL